MKNIICIVISLFVLSGCAVPALASGSDSSDVQRVFDERYNYSATDSEKQYVVDDADLLTDDEEMLLLEKIAEIRAKYSFDVVLHTTNSIDVSPLSVYTHIFYDTNGYGVGENYDGIMLAIDMGGREYYTSTCGYGIDVFTDYGIRALHEHIGDALASENYYEALAQYLALADEFLAQAAEGEPYDSNNQYGATTVGTKDYLIREAVVIAVALLVGFLVVSMMKRKMNTAVEKRTATEYIVPGSVNITSANDVFVTSRISKTPKAQSNNTKGSTGSSTHTAPSGRTHGGGGGKF